MMQAASMLHCQSAFMDYTIGSAAQLQLLGMQLLCHELIESVLEITLHKLIETFAVDGFANGWRRAAQTFVWDLRRFRASDLAYLVPVTACMRLITTRQDPSIF